MSHGYGASGWHAAAMAQTVGENVRRRYVTAMRHFRDAAERTGVLERLDRGGRGAKHVRSLFAIHDVAAMVDLDLPWWTYRATAFVERWLQGRNEARVFEYGSGASTVWLARRAPTVYSVEHDAGFASVLRPLLPDPSVLIQCEARADPTPQVPSRKEPNREFFEYVHAIDEVSGDFDLVVVDGRARIACVQMAMGRLKPGGLILLDDSWRREYREGLARLPLQAHHLPGAAPCLPYPSVTALLTADSARPGAHDQVGQQRQGPDDERR